MQHVEVAVTEREEASGEVSGVFSLWSWFGFPLIVKLYDNNLVRASPCASNRTPMMVSLVSGLHLVCMCPFMFVLVVVLS